MEFTQDRAETDRAEKERPPPFDPPEELLELGDAQDAVLRLEAVDVPEEQREGGVVEGVEAELAEHLLKLRRERVEVSVGRSMQ